MFTCPACAPQGDKLGMASQKNDLIKAAKLIKRGVDVNIKNPGSGVTPLGIAAERGHVQMMKLRKPPPPTHLTPLGHGSHLDLDWTGLEWVELEWSGVGWTGVTYIRAHTHAHTHIRMHTHAYAHIRMHTHTYAHIRTHTYSDGRGGRYQ